MEERHILVADVRGRRALLRFADLCQRNGVSPGVVRPGVAARAADQAGNGTGPNPARDRGRGAEIGIVRMGHDHQQALWPIGVQP